MLSERLQKSQKMVRQTYDPNFSWLINETVPWMEFKKTLAESKIAMVSSCGFYRQDMHLPFDTWNHLGDPSFREIHRDSPLDRLAVAHCHYDHRFIKEDINVAFPVERLKTLEQEGFFAELSPWIYSFMGYLPEPRQFVQEACPTIARRLQEDRVDGALFTPC
jgi:hypothetical protein